VAGLMSITSQDLLQRPDAADTDWRRQAGCRDVDPELFFPLGTVGASLPQIELAKQICRTCPVCRPCLRWALDHGADGVWGGTTEEERRRHRRSRAIGESGSAENSSRFS
jgi:WhiB family transcriptional regulator, redox-sensing transcriptional regulator